MIKGSSSNLILGIAIGLCVALIHVTAVAYFGGGFSPNTSAPDRCGQLFECNDSGVPIDGTGKVLSSEELDILNAYGDPGGPAYLAERDLQAQFRVAIATDRLVLISIASLAIGILGVAAVFSTLRTAVEGNEIARRQFVAEHRARLSLGGDVQFAFVGPFPDVQAVANIDVTNDGRSMATGVNLFISSNVRDLQFIVGNVQTLEFAETVATSEMTRQGHLIRPTQSRRVYGVQRHGLRTDKVVRVHICVVYRSEGLDDVFYTARSYDVPPSYIGAGEDGRAARALGDGDGRPEMVPGSDVVR